MWINTKHSKIVKDRTVFRNNALSLKKMLSMLILIVLFSAVYHPVASVIGETGSDDISSVDDELSDMGSSFEGGNASFSDESFVNVSILEDSEVILSDDNVSFYDSFSNEDSGNVSILDVVESEDNVTLQEFNDSDVFVASSQSMTSTNSTDNKSSVTNPDENIEGMVNDTVLVEQAQELITSNMVSDEMSIILYTEKPKYFVNEPVLLYGVISFNYSLVNTSVHLLVIQPSNVSSVYVNSTDGKFYYEIVADEVGEYLVQVRVFYKNRTIEKDLSFYVDSEDNLPNVNDLSLRNTHDSSTGADGSFYAVNSSADPSINAVSDDSSKINNSWNAGENHKKLSPYPTIDIMKNHLSWSRFFTNIPIHDIIDNKIPGLPSDNKPNRLSPEVKADVESGRKVRVIVKFKDEENRQGRGFAEKAVALEDHGLIKTAEIPSINVVTGVINSSAADLVREDNDVEGVYPDSCFSVLLSESLPLIRFDQAVGEFGLTGEGVKICILDTGVDPSVVDYSYGYDFVNDDDDPFDDHGHGTQVAAVIDSIAPDAELVVAKVIDSDGTGFESDVLEGLEYCIDQNPDIMLFSIGSSDGCLGFCDTDFVAGMCNDAVDLGVFVVAASGNDGSSILKSPACGSKVFSVGATDDNDDIAGFSNVNPILDLFAPGVDITTIAGTGSGTSMSAPHAAGAVLLVLENEDLSPSELKYRLRSTGKPIRYVYNSSLSIDIGRLDLYNAVVNNKTMEPFDYSWWLQGDIDPDQDYTVLAVYPNPPLHFTALNYNMTQINLSWIKGNNSNYTYVRWDTDSYPTDRSDGNLSCNITGTSFSQTGLPNGTTIYFRAWSYNTTYNTYSNTSSNISKATWAPPNVSSIDITPDPATTVNDLTCTYTYNSTSGKQGTSTYVWKVNDGTVSSGNASTLYSYSEHTVDGDFSSANSVYAADVDGDGDLDVLGAAYNADDIAWWENIDGGGTSWTEHTVDGDFDGASSVFAADVDGDGDMDVLGAALLAADIAWWENTDGGGTNWTEHTINGSFDGAYSVYAADVDGDGDLDVLGAAYIADDITWWENTDGGGTSWTEHTVDGDFNGARSVFAADVDGDGDLDVLGAAYIADDITWWENTDGGGTSWTEHTVDGDFDGASSVFAADVDGNGDMDVLGAAYAAADIAWWENTDGGGTSWTEHTVDGSFDAARSVFAADVDGDGDLDVLGAAYGADDITWWENTDGGGTSWTEHTVDGDFDGAWSVFAADVDGDGDLDVLGAAYNADDITWWEATQQGTATLSSSNFNCSDTVRCEITPVNVRGEAGTMISDEITISNDAPSQSNPVPSNDSIGVDVNIAQLSINVSDADGDYMNVTVRTNASGTWQDVNSTSNGMTDGMYNATNTSWINSYFTTYWWSVNLTDGTDWTNATYSFTTEHTERPDITMNSPSNGSGSVSPVTLNVSVTDDFGWDMTVKFYGDGGLLDTQLTSGNQTKTYSWSCGGGIHTWYVVVNETQESNTSDTWWFAVNYFNDTFNNRNYISGTDSNYPGALLTITNNSYVNFTSLYNNTVSGGLDGTERTIDTTMYDSTYEYGSSPRIVFISNTVGYAFSGDRYEFSYWKTTDGGETWGSPTNIEDAGHYDWAGAVWYDQWSSGDTGTKIHLTWTGTTDDELKYCYLDTSDDSLGSVVSVHEFTDTAPYDGGAAICKTENGRLWIAGFGSSTPTGGRIYYSDDDGATWTNATPSSYFDDDDDHIQLLPLPGGDIMCLYQDGTTLRYTTYDKNTGSWAAFATIDTFGAGDACWGASMYKKTGDIYLALNTGYLSAPADIVFWKYTVSNSTWWGETVLETDAYGYDASVVVSQGNGDIYVFYADGSYGSLDVYCQNSTDDGATWSTRQQISTTTDDIRYTTGNFMSYYRIYASWHNDDLNYWIGTTVRTYTLGSKFDATANITSVNITKPTGYNWNTLNVVINNTANSTFSILNGTTGVVILNGLDGSNNDISSITANPIKIWGEFNDTLSMDSWNVSWVPIVAPTVITNSSTGVEETNATLHGYLSDDGNESCTVRFEYGTTTSYGTNTTNQTGVTTGTEFSADASGLTNGQLYHYRAFANNTNSTTVVGSDTVFLTKPQPPSSFTAQANSSTMIYLTWTAGSGANTTYIERNTTSSWARGAGTEIYNDSGTSYEDTGLSENTTYYYQAWSYTSWTYNPTLDQWSDNNASASNKTNSLPTITSEIPANQITGASLTPQMNITVNDFDGDSMTITWLSNSSGSWTAFGTNSSVGNGTYHQTNSNFSSYNTTYYWSVNVTDGYAWGNRTYHFTTAVNQTPVFSNENPSNGSTGVSTSTSTLTITINDPEGDTFNWSIETSPNIGSASSNNATNGSKTCTISGLSASTTYKWYVNATDTASKNWTREWYTFTTAAPSGGDNGNDGGSGPGWNPPPPKKQTTSEDTMNDIEQQYNLTLDDPFYATDTNGDGTVDSFTDPNGVLISINSVDINGNASFLLSIDDDTIPEFFWDADADTMTAISYAPGTVTDTYIDLREETVTFVTNVDKGDWIYIDVIDQYPPDEFPTYNLIVKTSDNRIISENMIWRENCKIFVLDHPDVQYAFIYGYDILPASFEPPNGTTFNTTMPTIIIAYYEQVQIKSAIFGPLNVTKQIKSSGNEILMYTLATRLPSGTYTLSITVEDADNNIRTDTVTYIINIGQSAWEIPWLAIAAVCIALIAAVIFLCKRKNFLIAIKNK